MHVNSDVVLTNGIGWEHYPEEFMWSFVPMSVFYSIIFSLGCLILFALPRQKPGAFRRRVGRFGLFLALLLIVGSLFSGCWSCLIYEHLYRSSDYIADFVPFWPVTLENDPDLQIYPYGTSLTKLNIVWLGFAASTWAVTIVLYRCVRSLWTDSMDNRHLLTIDKGPNCG